SPDGATYGADGTFNLYTNISINSYLARTQGNGTTGDDVSYRGQFDYEGDRYGMQVDRLVVGSAFNPEVGFVRRRDMHKSYAAFRFSPRPAHIKFIRKFNWNASTAFISDQAGRLETRDFYGEFAIDFQNSDHLTAQHERDREFVPRAFAIAPRVTV